MATVIDDNTLVQCVALTAAPEFIDLTGQITGTRNAVYNPTFVGQRGHMLNVTAAPLDLGVPTTGDQLAICFNHRMRTIDTAIRGATPIATVLQDRAREQAIKAKAGGDTSAPPEVEVSEEPAKKRVVRKRTPARSTQAEE